jgi:hypothetical protein
MFGHHHESIFMYTEIAFIATISLFGAAAVRMVGLAEPRYFPGFSLDRQAAPKV